MSRSARADHPDNGRSVNLRHPVYGDYRPLFSSTTLGGGTSTDFNSYDVTADGQRFLTINSAPMDTTAAPPAPVTVVLNWTASLGAVSRR